MLILRRKIGERIVIDGQIEMRVLQVRGGKVRLGFTAPRTVRILRKEMIDGAGTDGDPTKADAVEAVSSLTWEG